MGEKGEESHASSIPPKIFQINPKVASENRILWFFTFWKDGLLPLFDFSQHANGRKAASH
jgi:hypothetical protein